MITLNGLTGITAPDFEPSSSTVPTNGMFLPTTNTLAWSTNSTERLRLDSSGNLGLGVTPSGTSKFETYTGAGAFNAITVRFNATNSPICFGIANSNGFPYLGFNTVQVNGTDNQTYSINNFASRLDAASGGFRFFTAPSGTAGNAISFTQAMTLDASGNWSVGNTGIGLSNNNSIQYSVSNAQGYITHVNGTVSGQGYWIFGYNGSTIGTIVQNGTTGVTYNTSSDQRLKENIVDAPNALDSVNAIKVRSFDWKSDGSHVDYGYIAQELLTVAPESVSVPPDPDEMMGVDFGKLTPRLVKAIQELSAELNLLKQKVNA